MPKEEPIQNELIENELILGNATILTPFEEIRGGYIHIQNGIIKTVGYKKGMKEISGSLPSGIPILDMQDRFVAPGFFDIHTHGAMGTDAGSSSLGAWIEYSAKNGTTSLLPTLFTKSYSEVLHDVDSIKGHLEKDYPIRILGMNLEGPFINPRYGVQRFEDCVDPATADYRGLIERAGEGLRIMTVAPELPGALKLIEYLRERDVVVSIGHTDASAEITEEAIKRGAALMTHAYNSFGYPGPLYPEKRKNKVCGRRLEKAIDVLLENETVYAELISDKTCVHVAPVLQRTLLTMKGTDKVILITDAVPLAGMPGGEYPFINNTSCIIDYDREEVLRVKETGAIGGSLYSIPCGIKNIVNTTGISLRRAVKTVTINPAHLLGVGSRLGSIEEGKYADLAVLNHDLSVAMTICRGKIIYREEQLE